MLIVQVKFGVYDLFVHYYIKIHFFLLHKNVQKFYSFGSSLLLTRYSINSNLLSIEINVQLKSDKVVLNLSICS